MFSKRTAPDARPACLNVLTPDRIPSFFIPPSLATLQGRRSAGNPRAGGVPGPPSGKGGTAGQEGERAGAQVHGAPSAFQLPGLVGLPESPNTRRRESLFHGGQLPRRFHGGWLTRLPWQRSPELDSDSPSSPETSPYNSPLPARPLSGLLSCQGYGHRRRLACRPANPGGSPRPSSLSLGDTSSTDTSPSCLRRETDPLWVPASAWPLLPLSLLDSVCCRQRLTKEVALTVSRGGRLRLSSEYLRAQQSLRVRLICAEGFYPPHGDPRHMHCCVALQLRPGLGPWQHSAIVKRSRNPIFNEDFFFEGILPEELPRRSLRFRVLNKACSLRRDAVLGECDVPLDSLLP